MERRFFVSGKPVASTMMLMQNEYKFVGELMAMSITQGGPAPNLFCQNVFDCLVNNSKIANIHVTSTP